MHSDLQAVMEDLASSENQARELIDGLTDEQVNWQPKEGGTWSISQCIDHLAQTNALYAEAILKAIRQGALVAPRRVGPIAPGWFPRFFIRTMEPPPRRRFAAPKNLIPASKRTGADALKAFIASHDGIRAVVREGSELDLNRIKLKNPISSLFHFTAGAGLLIMGAHDRRHLWQARQVRQRVSELRP